MDLSEFQRKLQELEQQALEGGLPAGEIIAEYEDRQALLEDEHGE